MKNNRTNYRKSLYLDARGNSQDVRKRLKRLNESLENLDPNELVKMPIVLTLAPPEVIETKLAELLNPAHAPYRMAEFADSHTGEDSRAIVRTIRSLIVNTDISYHDRQIKTLTDESISFPTIGVVQFDFNGTIIRADDDRYIGKDIYHLLACHLNQDIATVVKKGDKFIYTSDISRFEKTPKSSDGHNRFLGKDILEFHRQAPNFGALLGPIFEKLIAGFSLGNLEMLVVDLNGQGQFTLENGELVRRFERDHFISIKNGEGEFLGFLGIADVYFQPVTETRNPFEGGKTAGPFATQINLTQHDPIKTLENETASEKDRLAAIHTILANKDRFRVKLMARAAEVNKRRFGNELELYGISYISDKCVNNCCYCGLNSTRKFKRTSLPDEEMAIDFEAVLKYRPQEFCLLAGESPELLYLVQRALSVLQEVNLRNGSPLQLISLNIAPLTVSDFIVLVQSNKSGIPLQYRLFQESYDRKTYSRYHVGGPKSNFDFRLTAQERALAAGFHSVGIGVLLGLNTDNYPHEYAGNDKEIISLIEHAFRLKNVSGKFPSSLSIPRHKSFLGYDFITPNPVDDKHYIFYHALLRLTLPETKIIITSRETPELIRKVEPFINIRDLAPRPGVGGNIRPDVNFQNELDDSRSAEEIIRDLTQRRILKINKRR